jgi:hypothetical protein
VQTNNNKQFLQRKTLFKYLILFPLIVVLFFEFKFISQAFQDLRPIADDYCIASASDTTLLGSYKFWFNSWIGDLLTIFNAYIFLGWPILNLPYGAGSFVALFVTLIALTFAVYKIIFPSKKLKLNSKKGLFLLLTVFMFTVASWFTYWWLPAFLAVENSGTSTIYEQFLATVLHWQIVNLQYVLQLSIGMVITLFILDRKLSKCAIPISLVLGFIVGNSGYVLAATLFSLVLLEFMPRLGTGHSFPKVFKSQEFLFLFAIFIGSLISLTSPGAELRRSHFAESTNLGVIFPFITKAIEDWIDLIFSPTSIYVILASAALHRFLNLINYELNNEKLQINTLRLAYLSAACFVISKISEIFSYGAFWHEIAPRTFTYLFFVALGFLLSSKILNRNIMFYFPITFLITASVLLVSVFGLSQVSDRVEIRRELWEVGPAPAVNWQPADRYTEWINKCWIEINNSKKSKK